MKYNLDDIINIGGIYTNEGKWLGIYGQVWILKFDYFYKYLIDNILNFKTNVMYRIFNGIKFYISEKENNNITEEIYYKLPDDILEDFNIHYCYSEESDERHRGNLSIISMKDFLARKEKGQRVDKETVEYYDTRGY